MRAWIPIFAGILMWEAAHAAECPTINPIAKHGSNTAWKIEKALVYRTNILKVDADGAPNSYRVDGKGLSYTCDGVAAIENGRRVTTSDPDWQSKCQTEWAAAKISGNYNKLAIFGFMKDKVTGQPAIQKAGDPLPGEAFISTTFVEVKDAAEGTQRRYIDATAIPYVVLPEAFRSAHNVQDGALAAVYRPKTGKLAYAVFGDTGGRLDEASVRLQEDLGGKPYVKMRGVLRAYNNIMDQVAVVVFPDTTSKPRLDIDAWRADINESGAAALQKWGGAERLKACTARN